MLGDLREEPFVWYPRAAANFVYDPVLSACYTAGFTLNIVQEVNSPTTMLSLVAGGIGLSFVTESAERIKPNGVVLRDVGDLRVTPQFSVVWRKDNKAPALQKFVEMIRSEFTAPP
jgi:DNA-binding transcriptional LysR family regulator